MERVMKERMKGSRRERGGEGSTGRDEGKQEIKRKQENRKK